MPQQPPFSSLSTKRRIKLTVAYDGYDFKGFAPQKGQRTVHRTLTEHIRQISGDENIEIIGASRTDSGAHARGQVVHFDTAWTIPTQKLPRVINKILPNDVTIINAQDVPDDFNSRFWADKRTYRYRILTGKKDPHRTRYAWYYGKPLNIQAMQQATPFLEGKHSFLAFSQALEPGSNPVRTLHSVTIKQVRDEIWLDVVGTAFLKGMMRRIAGSLWEIGRGKFPPNHTQFLLQQTNKDLIPWPTLLPACGLTLMKITYGRHPVDCRTKKTFSLDE